MRFHHWLLLLTICPFAAGAAEGNHIATLSASASLTAVLANAQQPVLVEYGSTWCTTCEQLAPRVARVTATLGFQVVLVDIDQHPESTAHIDIIPRLELFPVGATAPQRIWIGGISETDLLAWTRDGKVPVRQTQQK